jgi:hypothetical protein
VVDPNVPHASYSHLEWLAEGLLSEREAGEVREHVAKCPTCANRLRQLESQRRLNSICFCSHPRGDLRRTSRCPPSASIPLLLANRLGGPARDQVLQHLAECVSCHRRAVALEARMSVLRRGKTQPWCHGRGIAGARFLPERTAL